MTGLFGSLVLFAVVTIWSPGASNLLTASSGAQFGVRASFGLIAGITTAVATLVAVSAIGVGAIVTSLPAAQDILRAAGTVYLLWLAVQIGKSGAPSTDDGPASPPGFGAGLMVAWLNPKTWTTVLSAAAGYSALSSSPVVFAIVLTAVFTGLVIPNLFVWCRVGEMLSRVLTTDRQWRTLNITVAVLLAVSIVPMWLE